MKSILSFIIALPLVALISGTDLQAQTCDVTSSKLKCKKELVPFRYTGMTVQRIFFRRYNQRKEVSFPLYFETKYRFVFNTENLPQEIKIEIYDSHSSNRKRNKIASFSSDEKQFTFEPDPSMVLPFIYVNFLIPASIAEDTKSIPKGCVVIMTGYEDEYAAFDNESFEDYSVP